MDLLHECKKLLQTTQQKIISSPEEWKSFLRFAAQIYKYDFTSAVLIYAKDPNATALATFETWNQFNRRINAGVKGIPTIIDYDHRLTLKFLFDVGDTNGDINTLPKHWTLKNDYRDTVLIDLEERYGIPTDNAIFDRRINAVIENIINQSYTEYSQAVFDTVGGSPLAGQPEEDIQNIVYDIISDSITYMVYSRIAPDSPILNSLLFDGLALLKHPEHLNIIGCATVNHSCALLRQIESSVKQIEFEQLKEQRRMIHGNRIQRNRRPVISPIGDSSAGGSGIPNEVRNQIQEIPEGGTTGSLRGADGRTGSDEGLPPSGAGSERVRGQNAEAAAQEQSPGKFGGYHENDSVQQLAVQDSRGNDIGEHRVSEVTTEQTDLQAVSDEAAFSVAQNEPDTLNGDPAYGSFITDEEFRDIYLSSALMHTTYQYGQQRIYDCYRNDPTAKEAIALIKKEYGIGGGTAKFSNGKKGFTCYDSKGFKIDVKLADGEYSRTAPWSMVEKTIRNLIDEGNYIKDMPPQKERQLSIFKMAGNTDSGPDKQQALPVVPTPATVTESPQAVEAESGRPSAFSEIQDTPFSAELLQEEPKSGRASALDFPESEKINYQYANTDEFTGGQKTHYKANIAAIQLLKSIESEQRLANPQEQALLKNYLGWGGLPQVFDKDNSNWQEEYKALKGLLTPAEYEAARASTLTAFYTPPVVVREVYTALINFGFTGGNIVDPACGTGRFFGFIPMEIADNGKLYGVELDELTGRIAKQLYQKAEIQITGFEKTVFPDNFADVAIGNVPFGQFKLHDSRYDKYNLLIHDYFFAKTIDKVRPGGMIAFVTSKGTLDKANPEVRKYIAQRAELIGAIRLPNTMMKAEANTNVTADIIFLKKRYHMVDIEPDWVNLTYLDGGIPVNTYFADHPEMMLGKMVFSDNMYGNAKDTALMPDEGVDWRDELPKAIASLQGTYSEPELVIEDGEAASTIPADPHVRNYSYTIVDKHIYYRENSQMLIQDITGMREQRIRGMIAVRDAMREVIRVQSEDYPDKAIIETSAELNRLYDGFTYKYGYLTSVGNKLAFSKDSDYPLLTSLENIDDDGHVTKAAIFSKRTIRPPVIVTHADTAVEALPHSLDENGCVNISFIAQLTGKQESEVIDDLKGIVYKNPIGGQFETSDQYLSGKVRDKLAVAESAAENDEQYAINVEALRMVQPADIDASQIDVRLGSPLLDTEDIKQFITDTLKPTSYTADHITVNYVPAQAMWKINGVYHSGMRSDVLGGKTLGTHRIDAYELIELSLNQKLPTIRDKTPDDKYVVNPVETAAAREKQRIINRRFEDWAFRDPQRRERLVWKYNITYNNIRLRQYDGSYLTFPGMTPEISLQAHQRNAVARILSSGNTLLAHCVGAGKTYTMITAAMEGKRLGLCNKSMFVVPGHLIDQWGADILKLYPGANVLLATKKDFEKSNRQRLVSRIATGDYDAIVIAQSSFEKIPISPERIERLLKKQIDDVITSMELAKDENGEDWTIKNMERTKKELEGQLQKLLNQSRKDNLLTFEELGVDQLFVDEAHYYKNLFVATKMSNVAGIGQQKAQKASDMLMKCRFINELNHGARGVVFATGTPISNSMSEMFTMQTFLQPDELEQRGISHFDAWAASFGRVVSSLELTPDGTQYRYKSRFAQFVNLPELMSMYSLTADVQSADILKLPVPKLKGEKAITIVAQPSAAQKKLVDEIVCRFEVIHNGGVEPWEDNALKATNDGRCGALDMRILDPNAEDFAGSKVNMAVRNIYDIWQRTAATQGTQMVFCDLSTPKGNGKFSVYEDMKQKLIKMGIPENEVAFIHDAHTEGQKEQLFSDFRSGKVRVLFGSTARMGAGTNAQRKLIAMHHMDAPWRPADLEQRDGRILRQGNENEMVEIYRYVTEGTFDAFSWQVLEQKQKFISQVSRGQCADRHAADIDNTVLDYATVKMLSSKDPRIKEREELRVRVAELSQLKAQYKFERFSLEDIVLKDLPEKIARNESAMQNLTKDISVRDSNSAEDFSIQLFGQVFTNKELAGDAILKKVQSYRKSGEYLPIGQYMGFNLELTYSLFTGLHSIVICGAARHYSELGHSAIGCVARMDNLLKGMEDAIVNCKHDVQLAEQQMKEAKAQLSTPWEHEQEYDMKTDQLNKLDIAMAEEMGADKEQVMEIDDEMEEGPDLAM